MKTLIKLCFTAICLCSVLFSIAQKPKNIKYKGYYKNMPLFNLNETNSNYYSKASEYVANIIKKDSLSLELKGFDKGEGITIVFSCSDPQTKAQVVSQERMVNNEKKTEYFEKITAYADSRVIFLDKTGKPFYYITAEPKKNNYESTGFKRDSRKTAQSDLKSNYDFKIEKVKSGYIRELYRAYQKELDILLGKFAKKEKFQVFTINSKNFDYSEFNDASNNFVKATSSPEINLESNQILIKQAIEVWTKNLNEFEDNKKARINPKNLDAIQFNLTMAYLVLGDGENYSKYWKKCIETKGSNNAEASAKWFMPTLVDNYQLSIENLTKEMKTDEFVSNEKIFENMIIANAFMNSYLSGLFGNLYYIDNYFPTNPCFVLSASVTKNHNNDGDELIKYNYGRFGELTSLKYEIKNRPDKNVNIDFKFIYDDKTDRIEKILANGKIVFDIVYPEDENSISQFLFYKSKEEKYSFRLNKVSDTKIQINFMKMTNSADPKLISKYNRIEFNNNLITDLSLAQNGSYKIKRDQNGNIVELTGSDPADNSVLIPFVVELDEKDNVIKSSCKFSSTKFNINYMY